MSNSIMSNFHKSDKIPKQCICREPQPNILKLWGMESFAYHSESEFLNQEIKVETVKLLNFNKNKGLSLHQHLDKQEFFFILKGKFFIEILDLSTQIHHSFYLNIGERIFIPRGLFHRMTCEDENGIILEISTLDKPSDSYRLIKSI